MAYIDQPEFIAPPSASSLIHNNLPKRGGERRQHRLFLEFWAPVAHSVFSIVLALALFYSLDRHGFNPTERENLLDFFRGDTALRASDITTIVSASLLVIRLLGQAISGVTVWRCAFILLQQHGLTLRQLDTMISYQIPTCGTWSSRYSIATTTILLMMLPSTFLAPILSGSIGWVPSEGYEISAVLGGFGSTHRRIDDWDVFRAGDGRLAKTEVLLDALGVASMIEFDYEANQTISDQFRYIPIDSAPEGTLVEQVPMPYIEVHNITWEKGGWDTYATDTISNNADIRYTDGYTAQSFTVGNAVLFDHNTTIPSRESDSPMILSLTKRIGVLVARDLSLNETCRDSVEARGWSEISDVTVEEMRTRCWVLGTVSFTVGIKIFDKAKYLTNRVMEAMPNPVVYSGELIGDQWAEYTVYMMSDMMSTLPGVRRGDFPTGNLTLYAESLLRHSYIGMRSALYPYTPEDPSLTSRIPYVFLQAHVDRPRVVLWLILALMLPLSSSILLWIDHESVSGPQRRKPVLNSTLTPLLTDVREVLEKDNRGISNVSYLTDADNDELGRVKLSIIREKDGKAFFGLRPE